MTSETKRLLAQAKTTLPSYTESTLRLAALAFFFKKRDAAMTLLRSVGESRLSLAQVKAKKFDHVALSDLPNIYRNLNETCEAARLQAEGHTLIALAAKFKKTKT